MISTAANVNDVTQGHALLHGEETEVFADAGYQGSMQRPEATGVEWQVAMRPGQRRALPNTPWGRTIDQIEKCKASIRAKVEHPFRVIKRQFGYVKVRYRGLMKNTAQLMTLFALSNLWMARRQLLSGVMDESVHRAPKRAANRAICLNTGGFSSNSTSHNSCNSMSTSVGHQFMRQHGLCRPSLGNLCKSHPDCCLPNG